MSKQYFNLNFLSPADLSDTGNDVFGESLEYNGKAKFNVELCEAPCLTLAVNDTLTGSFITSGDTVTNDGTATFTVTNGTLTCSSAGTVYNLQIEDETFPCIEVDESELFNTDASKHLIITAASLDWTATQDDYFYEAANGYSERLNLQIFVDSTTSASTPDPITYRVVGSDFIINGEFGQSSAGDQTLTKPASGTLEIGLFNPELVTELRLDNQHIENTETQLFSNFPLLKKIFMAYCGISGELDSFSTTLTYIKLSSNSLCGEIPSLSLLTGLQMLYLQGNSFTGSAPSPSNCTALLGYNIHVNSITGNIPSFSSNTLLTTVNVSSNSFTGYLGSSMPSSVTTFNASNNALTQSAVDAILVQLDSAGTSNGTCSLQSGTNSAPSSTGLTAKTNLESKGWTVTVNS